MLLFCWVAAIFDLRIAVEVLRMICWERQGGIFLLFECFWVIAMHRRRCAGYVMLYTLASCGWWFTISCWKKSTAGRVSIYFLHFFVVLRNLELLRRNLKYGTVNSKHHDADTSTLGLVDVVLAVYSSGYWGGAVVV